MKLLVLLGLLQALAGDVFQFEFPLDPKLSDYSEILDYPPYLYLALQNAGVKVKGVERTEIVDPKTLRLYMTQDSPLQWIEAQAAGEGRVQLKATWGFAPLQKTFDAAVQLDTSRLTEGFATIRLDSAGIPDIALGFLKTSLQHYPPKPPSTDIQIKLLQHLEAAKRSVQGISAQSAPLVAGISLYSLQHPANVTVNHRPGDVEAVSDQGLFILTVGFWAMAILLFFSVRLMRNLLSARRKACETV